MKKVLGILFALVWCVILGSCTPREAPATRSADNATPSIETVMYSIKDQDFETLAAFNSEGKLIFDTTSYEPDAVNADGAQLQKFWKEDGTVMMHNHPSGSTFSPLDLMTEARRGTRRAIVVTSGVLYVLEPGPEGWGDAQELYDTYVAYSEQYAEETPGRFSPFTAHAAMILVQHEALLATAADYGLNYLRIPLDEFVCFQGVKVVMAAG